MTVVLVSRHLFGFQIHRINGGHITQYLGHKRLQSFETVSNILQCRDHDFPLETMTGDLRAGHTEITFYHGIRQQFRCRVALEILIGYLLDTCCIFAGGYPYPPLFQIPLLQHGHGSQCAQCSTQTRYILWSCCGGIRLNS